MGKSSVLWRLSKQVEDVWKIWIDLKKIYKHLNYLSVINIDSVTHFLLHYLSNNSEDCLTKALLKFSLQNNNSVSIFFDGFDEIQDVDKKKMEKMQKKVLDLFEFLNDQTSAKIWIATRLNAREILEKKLLVFSIRVKGIEEEERIEFWKELWLLRMSLEIPKYGQAEKAALENYAQGLLKNLENMRKDSLDPDTSERGRWIIDNSPISFTGIFLQMKMIGEVFQPNVSDLSKPIALLFQGMAVGNYFTLYNKFIESKYKIYFEEKMCHLLPQAHVSWSSDRLAFKHKLMGFAHLFPDLARNLLSKELSEITFEDATQLNRVGLIQLYDFKNIKNYGFVHRTFAEYFAAQKLVDMMQDPPKHSCEDLYKFLAKNIFREREFIVIRRFINDGLEALSAESSIFSFLPRQGVPDRNYHSGNILHLLVREGNDKSLRMVLTCFSKEPNFSSFINDQKDYPNYTPLHMAIRSENSQAAFTLLEFEPDVNLKNFSGISCLYSAACYGMHELAFKLIELGADTTNVGYVYGAAISSQWALVFSFIGNRNLEVESKSGNSLLHYAAETGCMDAVLRLLNQGANINLVNLKNMTPMYCAAVEKKWKVVKTLITKGADVTIIASDTDSTVLHHASRSGQLDVVEMLINKKADLNAFSKFYSTPLICAVAEKHSDVALLLLKQDVDVNVVASRTSEKNYTALHYAAKNDLRMVASELINKGANMDYVNSDLLTPAQLAIAYCRWDLAMLLLENGAGTHHSTDLLFFVSQYFCDEEKMNQNNKYCRRDVALKLLNCGANPYYSLDYQTPIYVAGGNGLWELVFLFLDHGGEINKKCSRGSQTILHVASSQGNKDVALELIKKGADVNAYNCNHETPLFFAAEEKHWDLLFFLIDEGGDLTWKNSDNITIIEIVEEQGEHEVVKKLKEKIKEKQVTMGVPVRI